MKTIYYNGTVYTGALPLAEAFIVQEGRFAFAGTSRQALEQRQAGDQLVDLQGKFVCSGFNDSHMHLLELGYTLQMPPLADHTGSLADLLDCLRDFHARHPNGISGWLMGRGWNEDLFSDLHRMPDRHDLDQVSTEVPICIIRACGHCLVVNSRALEQLGLTADVPQPAGGRIGIQNGELDGRFFDNAMDLVYGAIPAPDKKALKEMILTACQALNAYGITSSQTDDYCVFRAIPWQVVDQAYQELKEENRLTVRVNEQCNFATYQDLQDFVSAGGRTGNGDTMFRTGPVKIIGDGALGARTALLSQPYQDDPSTCGLPVYDRETLEKMIGYAHTHGLQTATHAIGDACLDWVLDALEKALTAHPRADHRHGIVHCQITRADQLERIRRLQLHVYAQSIFLDYDIHIVEARVGSQLASTSYNWKTLLRNGVTVSNGSDSPVERPDVMAGIQCAVTRTTLRDHLGPYLPDQKFTVQEALDSFTIAGARASFEESCKGRIAPGFLADFVVLEENPFTTALDHLHAIPVCATYLGGQLVYQAAAQMNP